MKVLIGYDTYFGNTKDVSEKIKSYIDKDAEVIINHVDQINVEEHFDLLVLGSPTRGFNYTPVILNFMKKLNPEYIDHICVFDTRMKLEIIKHRWLVFMMKKFGFASNKMEKYLNKKNKEWVVSHNGFDVLDSKGPLAAGELDKAKNWVEEVIDTINK